MVSPHDILKELAPEISSSISCIFNKSLNEGSFPKKWKDFNLTPVFKADLKDTVSNYRGIALLPILSKFLEGQVHARLYHHVLAASIMCHTTSSICAHYCKIP